MRREKAKHCFAPTQDEELCSKCDSILRQGQQVKYAFIKEHKAEFKITTMCRVLSVKPSSYYDWLKRAISKQQIHRNHCELLVKSAHEQRKQKYGYERLHSYLAEQGHDISKYMVRSIKEEHAIYCKTHKRYKVTTDSDHDKLVYDNVLNREFEPTAPNTAWCSDITYLWTNEGWLYLAGVKDLNTKEIVGYALGKRMTADLVCKALIMAINNQQPSEGLIVHSDRGSQYCSYGYHKIIKKGGFIGSMSRKSNCYDNAPIESFWGTLKNELVYNKVYETREQAYDDITSYIELEYNQVRIQKSLGMKSPRQVRFEFYQQAA